MIDFLTVAVYIVVWWLVLALLVPIRGNPEDTPAPGNAPSAPKKTYLKQKIIGATLFAVPITWGIMQLY